MADTPFRGANGFDEPRFVLARVDEKHYLVDEPFWYVEPSADRPVAVGSPTETGLESDGSNEARRFRVPADGGTLTTDLASVPQFLTWLVPKDGRHTPAAILHDALMPSGTRLYDGPKVDRVEADRIFRNAMRHLGVPFLRRWIIWSAVSMMTFVGGDRERTSLARSSQVGSAASSSAH